MNYNTNEKSNFNKIQEELKNDFNSNFINYIKISDSNINDLIFDIHIKLKNIFIINDEKIELLENTELKNILIELYNKSMIYILDEKKELNNQYINDKNLYTTYYSLIEKEKYFLNNNNTQELYLNNYLIFQKEQNDLYIKKNKDYGDAYLLFGIIGIIVRIQDKIQRLLSIMKNKIININNETLLDTIIDLCNYSILALMLLK